MTLDEKIAKLKAHHIQMGRAAMSHPQEAAYKEIRSNWDKAIAIIDELKAESERLLAAAKAAESYYDRTGMAKLREAIAACEEKP